MPAAISRPYRITAEVEAGRYCLATLRFGPALFAGASPQEIHVPLAVLDGAGQECWLSKLPVRSGWQDGLGYSENDEVLLAQVRITAADVHGKGVDQATFIAYHRLWQLMQARGYTHTLRLWNFIPQILAGEGDTERYRLFNVGRSRALETWPATHRQLPAATAIGTPEGDLLIYSLASARVAGWQAENPRQLPATQYPRQYGVSSPNFSRATRLEWADGSDLLVSGTASVVGHETRHPGDVLAQLEETLANLAHLVAHAEQQRGGGRYLPSRFKLYLKSAAHLPLLLPRLGAALGSAPISCLQGTICRHDLLVEIEGIYSLDNH